MENIKGSRDELMDEGEKPTKYLLNLENRNYKMKQYQNDLKRINRNYNWEKHFSWNVRIP